ncbi:MAG: hypothetical protein H0V63_07120, partial [Burkholderiaceae bacterium]|nr:hypothetical protein [Burkholderiaceae bacterium]
AYVEYDGPIAPIRQPLDSGAAAGALQEAMNASDDLKAIIGIHDAGMGAQGNERSGVAIRNRQRESDVSTFHFIDNLARAVRHGGRILVDLIPQVYEKDRIIRILGEDGSPEQIQLGQPIVWKDAPRVFDLAVGSYDVVVKAGPSYSTRREEAATQQIEFIRAVPQLAPDMLDILAKNLDWPQADKLAERIEKKMNAPQGPAPELLKEQAKGQVTMQIEAARMQASTQQKQADAQVDIQKFQAEAALKAQAEQIQMQHQAGIEREKIASNERIKAAQIQADRETTMLELASGILAAREGVKGVNLTNSSTLDQHAQAISGPGQLFDVLTEIQSLAQNMSLPKRDANG